MRARTTAALIVIAAAAIVAIYLVMVHGTTPVHKPYTQGFCLNAAPNSTAMAAAVGNGIKCFRTDISLSPAEISFVSNVTRAGGQYLGILDYDTLGVQIANGACAQNCNWTLADWNASVEDALAAYPEVHAWEIWNEPLVPIFESGYENGSAHDYYNMIKGASTIIKTKYPNDTVVCFGGAQVYPESYAEFQFYQQVWNYGASKYCDAVSLHAYSNGDYNFADVAQEYNYTLGLYENLTGKPVWVTETGLPSSGSGLSPQRQAAFLSQDLDFFAAHQYVKRIYWFHLVGAASGGADYGLLNSSTLQPKPAWSAFLRFTGNTISG